MTGLRVVYFARGCTCTCTCTECSPRVAGRLASRVGRDAAREAAREACPTDSITSSYGVGPTDDRGRPLFGLKALRRTNTNKTLPGKLGELGALAAPKTQDWKKNFNSHKKQHIAYFSLLKKKNIRMSRSRKSIKYSLKWIFIFLIVLDW